MSPSDIRDFFARPAMVLVLSVGILVASCNSPQPTFAHDQASIK